MRGVLVAMVSVPVVLMDVGDLMLVEHRMDRLNDRRSDAEPESRHEKDAPHQSEYSRGAATAPVGGASLFRGSWLLSGPALGMLGLRKQT